MRLISELKRRNVLRMALLYAAAAWFVMQVAEVVSGLVGLPEQFGRVLLIVLAIGFPIALVVSWFYELTPEGIARDGDTPSSETATPFGGRRIDFVIIAMLAATVILLLVWKPPPSAEGALTILPFESMAGPEEAEFSEGVSIELLNLVAQLRKFKVKQPPEASILARFPDVRTLAQEMDVRWVLKGSVRQADNRVRVAVQLIDVADDASIVWSNVFDREMSAVNLFGIQTEIARSITSELRQSLDEPGERRLAAPPTENTEAYSAYLLGRQRLTDRKVADLADAVEQFALAIERDPRFAGAYSGLVDACYLYDIYSGGQSNVNCPDTPSGLEQLARRALEIDPESGEAWISLGSQLYAEVARAGGMPESMPRLREAIAAYERGLELNPNVSQGYHWLAMAQVYIHLYPDPPSGWINAWREGAWQSVLDKGLEVDPLSIPLHYMKAAYPMNSRNKDEAIRHGYRMIEIAPDSPRGYETLGEQAWVLSGRLDESIRWEDKAMAREPDHSAFATSIGRAYATLGDYDMALAYFDLAKSIVATENKSRQNSLSAEKTLVRLLTRNYELNELEAQLGESAKYSLIGLGVYFDLAQGRPEDALAQIEALRPKCFDLEDKLHRRYCPEELVRVYEELGDDTAARYFADDILVLAGVWADGYPAEWAQLDYVRALALSGRTDDAIDALEKLVSSGWRGHYRRFLRFTLYFDVTLDAIRDDDRFETIVATLEADMAQQLENVRAMQRAGEIPTLEEVRAKLKTD